MTDPLNIPEQALLLELARASIAAGASGEPERDPDDSTLMPRLREPGGCFVTLTKGGELRGCIGNLYPRDPLYLAVMDNARGAAFRDSRFGPVREGEIPELEIEISVLSQPTPLAFESAEEILSKLRPGVDGVVLSLFGQTATFLPQVWRRFADPARFLTRLAEKARLPGNAWQHPEVTLSTYQVQAFGSAERE